MCLSHFENVYSFCALQHLYPNRKIKQEKWRVTTCCVILYLKGQNDAEKQTNEKYNDAEKQTKEKSRKQELFSRLYEVKMQSYEKGKRNITYLYIYIEESLVLWVFNRTRIPTRTNSISNSCDFLSFWMLPWFLIHLLYICLWTRIKLLFHVVHTKLLAQSMY